MPLTFYSSSVTIIITDVKLQFLTLRQVVWNGGCRKWRSVFCCSVLISKGDLAKISDFGTSREWNEKSTKMSFAGTVAWMAPEVIRNEPCSEKVDIWCACLILCHLLVTSLLSVPRNVICCTNLKIILGIVTLQYCTCQLCKF